MAMTLSNSPAEIVRALLILLGLGTDPSPWSTGVGNPWPVIVEGEPNAPDNLLKVTDTVGHDDGRNMTEGEVNYHHGFQIKVRSSDHPTGYAKTDSIRTAIATAVGGTSVTVGVHTYQVWCVAHIGPVLPIGKETPSSKRSLFTLNATLSVLQTS